MLSGIDPSRMRDFSMHSTASRDFYNTIARYYDAENENMTGDLELYSALAEESGGPILDVGCGTGRIMLHLAGDGHQVFGVDTSSAMLERARLKAKRRVDLTDLFTFYEGNGLDFAYPANYAMIIVPCTGL